MIFGSMMLEIAISLFFVYLLLSLLCSAVNEWIAGYLTLRGKTLRTGIASLLADPVLAHLLDVSNLADKFYDHPLINRLGQHQGAGLPSYIPGHDFARAALDMLLQETHTPRPATAAGLYQTVRDTLANLADKGSDLSRTLLLLVEEAGFDPRKAQDAAQKLQELQAWRQKLSSLTTDSASGSVSEIATVIQKTISELESSLRQTETEIEATWQKALGNVETYFDDAMQRVSGWYKRRIQRFLFFIAIALVLLLNVDTLEMVSQITTNATLRSTLVAAATNSTDELAQVVDALRPTPTADGTETQPAPATEQDAGATVQERLQALEALKDLGLPIGWHGLPQGVGAWLFKLLGLTVTAIAVSFGAPFWFDLLNKLVNLRMTGKKPEGST